MAGKLIRGRYVVTDASRLPDGGLLEDAAVAIEGDRVAAVGPYEVLRERYPGAEELGSDNGVVIPGLINTHHHGWGLTSFQLGFNDDYLESWILDVWQLKPVDAFLDCLWADLKNIRSGVTTLLHSAYGRDWSNYERETQDKLRAHQASGIRAAYALHTLNQHTFVYEDDQQFLSSLPGGLSSRVASAIAEMKPATTGDFFSLLDALQQEYAGHSRITIMLGPVAPQWVSDGVLARVRERASEYGAPIHIHCLESPYQREFGRAGYGKSTVEHLREIGFLGPDVSLGHAVWLTERDMDICADTGTSVCHNASSNLRLRSGILPAARLLEKGVNVSIGMDGMTINDDEDMLNEIRLVAKLHRLPRYLEYTPCPSSFDVLAMATVNGGRTLGLGSEIGKLEPGYKADAVLIDLDEVARPYLDPRLHVVDAILYRARSHDVDTVVIDGEVVLKDRQFVNLDENEVISELVASAEAPLAAKTQEWFDLLAEVRPHVVRFYQRWDQPDYEPCYTPHSLT